MGFKDYLEEKRKKEQKSFNGKNETTSSSGGFKKYLETVNDPNKGIDENYINTFISDANDYFTNADKDYKSIGYKNASSIYNNYSSKSVELGKRSGNIRAYLNSNKNKLDEKTYNSLTSTLNKIDSNRKTITDQFKSSSDYYSKWKTEDDYKKSIKAQEEYEAKVNLNTDAAKNDISYFESELNAITSVEKQIAEIESEEDALKLGVLKGGQASADKLKENEKRLKVLNDALENALEKYGSKEELTAYISEKKAYLNQAENIQKGIKLTNDALNAEDFAQNNQYVSTKVDGTLDKLTSQYGMGYNDLTYEYINNIDGMRDKIKEKYKTWTPNWVKLSSGNESTFEEEGYEHMSEDEVKIYNYYYSTEGKDKAEEFLKSIQESLRLRKATADFEDIKDNTFSEILFGVEAGLDQFSSGIQNLFNFSDDYIPATATQMTSGMVREDLEDTGFKILGSSIGQIGYDLTTTTSNMLPSILTSTAVGIVNPVAGQAVGAGLMGASASGNAYAEMLNLGYDKGSARLYSGLVGASEATLQYLLGGIGKLGGGKLTTEAVVGIANNMDNAFARVALKLGANAMGEFTEEYLQEVLNPFFKNLTLGTDEDIKLFSTEALYSGILGALSAGILEGGSTISSDIQTTKLGEKVQNIDGGVEKLKKLGTTFSADSVAYQIADKVTEETGAYKIGLLLQEAGATLSEQNVSDITIELSKVMDERSAKRLAKTYQSFLNNEMSLSDEQVEVLEGLDPLSNVLRKSIIGRNTSTYQRTREFSDLYKLATEMESAPTPQVDAEPTPEEKAFLPYSTEYVDSVVKKFEGMGMPTEHAQIMAEMKLSAPTEGKSSPTEENIVESKFEVSAEGKTINKTNDEIVSIKNIESISDDGEANLSLDDGMVVKASDLSFGSDAEAIFVENIGAMKIGKNPISTNSANALYMTAMSALEANPNMTSDEAMSLIKGLGESYFYGAYNLGRSKLTSRNEDGSARLFAGELSQEQRKYAYELGTQDSINKTEADQKVIDELKAKAEGRTSKKSLGKVIFEKGAEVDESALTETQKANLDGIKLLAEISSVEFHVFHSDKTNNFKYTMPDGTVRSANGWFVAGTNEIWIDLNAGNAGEGTMIRTAAHEISHYIKQWSPQKWRAMADLLMKSFAENGVDTESMLNRQIAKIKRRYTKNTMPSETQLLDMAHEELVSDAFSDMLTDGSIVNFIAEVKAKDMSLAKKILNAIKSLLKKWGLIIDDYKGRSLDTPEAQALSQLEDTFKKLQEMYQEAFMDANEAVALTDIVNIDADSKSVSPMMSERTWTESEYVTEREKAAKAISSALGVDINTAYKYIDDINSVARLIADDRVRLDYDPNIDEDATVLKKNSEYKYSVDMSTLCAKRLLTTGTFDAIQRKLPNTVFSSEDIVALREMMLKRGYEVACGICYVESTRREMGRITQDFINSYIESQKTGKPITRINSSGKVVDLKKTKDEMLTTADKSADKFYADKDYTPTLADLNTTDIDLVKKEHPLVYEAYLNFMNARGQAKPKLLETRAEYKGEILKHFKTSTAVKARNNAGGLRLQSFSDFEVPHLIDMMQIVMDMSRVGLKSQAYTKVPAFAEAFGNTGVKINLSLIAKGSGLDANGNLIFDDVEGINHKEAFKLRDKFSKNVGTILVGKTDAHIIAAMADPRIDYIIPFHKSSWKESLYESLGLTGYADYTDFQNEKPIDKDRKIKNFDPSEYWDFTKSGDENAQIYLKKCREDGRIPKFPQFQGYPGYWKLLIDFKMYDNDGVGSPQEVVNPTFEMDAAEKILNEYKGGHRNFPVAKDVVEDFVNDYVSNAKFSDRDTAYMDAVNRGDMETAQRLVDEAAKEAGYTIKGYHGSRYAFNKFSKEKLGSNTNTEVSKRWFFAADEETANSYYPYGVMKELAKLNSKMYNPESLKNKGKLYSLYLKFENPLIVDVMDYDYASHRENKDAWMEYVQQAEANDNDGIVLLNAMDNQLKTSARESTVYMFKEPSQAKLTDPVTYDDKSNVIPLSERFNAENEDIRYSDRDSEGNELSKGQQEFFKDSKIRDENGNLLVVYHGTPKGSTTIFDKSKTSKDNDMGQGIYFSTNISDANEYRRKTNVGDMGKSYRGKVYSAYVNIENPFVVSESENISLTDVLNLLKLCEDRMIAKDVWYDLNINAKDGYVTTSQLANSNISTHMTDILAKSNKYDGIIDETVSIKFGLKEGTKHIVALNSNQIKETTNKTPTTDPDIRYSDRDYVETDSKAVMTTERIDYLIEDSGAGSRVDYANYWITSINPTDFLNMTLTTNLQDRSTFDKYPSEWNENSTVDTYDYIGELKKNMRQTPYLAIDITTGKVDGHEGRHRMRALEKKGITSVEIRVEFRDEDGRIIKYSPDGKRLQIKDALKILNQYGTKQSTTIENIIPLNKDYREEILANYGENFAQEKDIRYSDRDFSYETIVSKPDMSVTLVNDKLIYKPTSSIRKNIVNQAIKNASSLGKTNENGNVLIHVDDIDTDIILSKNSIAHGLDRRLEISAPVILNIGSVLKNSIRINELTPKKQSAIGSYVLIGYAESTNYSYPVRMVVNQYTNEVDTIDVLYAVNTKKETVGKMPGSHGNAALPTVSTISISNLLDYVNKYFPDILPESVLKHYKHTERPKGDLGESALFSDRDSSASNRSILANALEGTAQNDIERNKLTEYKKKISQIELEEQRLSEIQKKLFTKGAVEPSQRKDLQFEAKQIANRINTYDRQLLNLESTTALKNVLNREKALAMKRQKQKDTEYLKQYKEKVAKTQRELLERNQESRKKAIEGREKTAMRHKIKSVVNDLNNLLLKPSKERHVPEEMRLAVAEALGVVNMDTVDADTRVAKYNDLIAKAKDPDVIASLTETRDRILNQGSKLADKLTKLKDAYAKVRDSADDSVSSMYDDVIYSRIETVQNKIGKTPIRNMTLEQLESVYDLYKMVLTTIRDSNKAFAENITMTRLALGSNTFAEIKEGNKSRDTIKHPSMERFLWQNLKPMQAMKNIGSATLQKLWNNILYGQEVFAVDYDEAVKFAKEMKDKHGYKKWNLNKLYSFESKSGKAMKLNLEQMMSIYAYSKRPQADEHIELGGVVLNEGVRKVKNKLGKVVEVRVNDSTAYRLDKTQVGEIIDTLEKEFPSAKAFVDDMQKYLSETMGAKGNEVSMKMYGIKLFKEEHYFPLKSSKDFMEAANAKLKGDVKIKNKGMTKSTVEHARNPIVLENFLDVWGNHINEMALYHGLVLPLEDFSRTLNYSFKADEKLNTDAESVRTALHDAFGESADNYLNELLKAINGGVLHDSSAHFADKMISKFKKAKVMASLSVIVQQPTAIIRAMGIIEPKYFVAQNFRHKATWEELKKYCPTAIIKETGSFDTNMGKTIVDMVKEESNFVDKVGDILGKAPAYMDEVGWNMIWRALKKKVAKEQKLSGEALLQECGKQMTLIINETQVYDSVMSRNELMRSKNPLTKMATAFMAEPSTVANMIYGAGLDFKRGKKGVATKTVAATITSVVINGLVSAMVYAMRDDDEEKTLLEKYVSSATSEVLDGLNPLTYIPFVKDAYSLFQGYKVERTDMALIKDVVDAIDDFYNVLDPEAYEDMSKDEIKKHIYENSVPMLTSICDMFGLPVGNILRDAKAIIVNDNVPMSQTSSSGTGYAFKEGALNTLPKIVQKFIGTDSKQDKLYDAIVDGDIAYIERLKSTYKDDKAYETAVRKTLRENDTRIKKAAEASYNDDITKYADITNEIIAEGNFDVEDIKAAIKAEANKLKPDEAKEESGDENESIFETDHYYSALVNGKETTAYEVKEDIIDTEIANGKDRDEVEESFYNSFKNNIRDGYAEGTLSRDKAMNMLIKYGDMESNDAYWQMKKYDYYASNGTIEGYSKYDDFYTSVKTGKNLRAVIKEYTDHGVETKTLTSQITSYFKPLYKEMSSYKRASIKGYLLNAYQLLGKNRYEKSKDIDNWLKD